MQPRESIEWCRMWVMGADEDQGAPRVLLVGDSLTDSYYAEVEQGLGAQARCAKLTTSLCVCDPRIKMQLALLLDEFAFDLVRFNNGHHGWEYTETQYAQGLADVLDFIIERGRGCRLVWVNTSPAWRTDGPEELAPLTERVKARNRLAADLAAARGLPIHDLYAEIVDDRTLFADDGVHLSGAGVKSVARTVVERSLAELGELRPLEGSQEGWAQ